MLIMLVLQALLVLRANRQILLNSSTVFVSVVKWTTTLTTATPTTTVEAGPLWINGVIR